MIKKLILLLLVVCGGVVTANAWNNNDVYLYSSIDNWDWNNRTTDSWRKFTSLGSDEWTLTIDKSKIHGNEIWFAICFEASTSSPSVVRPNDGIDASVSTTKYETWTTGASGAFYIKLGDDAIALQIHVKYNYDNGNHWYITAAPITKTYNVTFTTSDWTTVNAYAFKGDHKFYGIWPGTKMSGSGGTFTASIPACGGAQVIFNNGSTKTADLVLENGNYTSSGISTVTATLGKWGYTTFASSCALDLSNISGATAYYVSATPSNSVKLVEATGTVQAEEGLILYGETANAQVTIPVTASGSAISGNLLKGCTAATVLDGNTTGYESIYVLVNTDTRPEFQNVKECAFFNIFSENRVK